MLLLLSYYLRHQVCYTSTNINALFFVSNAWYKQRERKGGIRSKILPIKYILYEHREVCRQSTLNNYTIYNNKPISLSLSLSLSLKA